MDVGALLLLWLLPALLGALCVISLQCCWSACFPPSNQTTAQREKNSHSRSNSQLPGRTSKAKSRGEDNFAYFASSGKIIHMDPTCSGMKNPEMIQKCSKCFKLEEAGVDFRHTHIRVQGDKSRLLLDAHGFSQVQPDFIQFPGPNAYKFLSAFWIRWTEHNRVWSLVNAPEVDSLQAQRRDTGSVKDNFWKQGSVMVKYGQ